MLDIAVRLIAAFSAHAQHGVKEMAFTLPRTNLGGKPDDAAPPDFQIYNDSDDKTVAKDLTAPSLPAVLIWGDSAEPMEVRGHKIAKRVAIAMAYVTAPDVDPFAANRACGYILRGGVLTMGRYDSGTMSAGYRELNGIKIHQIQSVTEQRITATVGKQRMWGFLDIRATVVETFQ